MPLDESILGGSVPFDPNETVDNAINALSDQPQGSPIDNNMVLDRAARKLLRPRAPDVAPPESKYSRAAKPDLSSLGDPVEDTPEPPAPEPSKAAKPDLSALGEPVTGIGGNAKAFGKGVVQGAVGATGDILKGVAAEQSAMQKPPRYSEELQALGMDNELGPVPVLPQNQPTPAKDRALYKAGEATRKFGENLAPMSQAEKDSIAGRVGQGLGTVGPYVLAGAALGPEAGIALGAAGGAAQSAGATYADAISKGASEDDAVKAAGMSGLVGAAGNALPVGMIFKPIEKIAGMAIKSRALNILAEAAKSGVVFGSIGEAQEYLGQQIAKQMYDPKAGYDLDTKRVIASLITGGLLGGAHAAFGRGEQQAKAPDNALPPPDANAPAGTAPGGGPDNGPRPDQGGVGSQKLADILRHYGYSEDDIAGMSHAQMRDAIIRETQDRSGAKPATGEQSSKTESTTETKSEAKPAGNEEYSILRAGGYSDENIADMSAAQRKSEAAYYRDELGLDVADAVKRFPSAPEPSAPEPSKTEATTTETLKRRGFTDGDLASMSADEQRKAMIDNAQPQGDLYARAKAVVTGDNNGSTSYLQRKLGLKYSDAQQLMTRMEQDGVVGPLDGKGGRQVLTQAGSRTEPIKATTADDVIRASEQVVEPTAPQAEAENYKHGHIDIEPLGLTGKNNISIETGVGQTRKGVDADGKEWSVQMPVAYGRIKGTKGADGEPLDIFIGPNPTSNHVFIVDQHHPGGGGFDEHKILAGFVNPRAALKAYKDSYTDGAGDRIGGVTAITADEFKTWLKSGDHTAPYAKKEPVSSTHGEETGSNTPFAEADAATSVPKEATQEGATPSTASKTQTPVNETSSGIEGEIISPARVYAEPAEEHHQQIEAVLGQDYDRVLPADTARAAEILADNPDMPPAIAFQHAVIENAVAGGYLTEQEAKDAYGPEVQGILEPVSEGTPRSGGDLEQERAEPAQERAGDAEETGVVSRGGEAGEGIEGPSTKPGQGAVDHQPDTGRGTADKSDTGGETKPGPVKSETKTAAEGELERKRQEYLNDPSTKESQKMEAALDKIEEAVEAKDREAVLAAARAARKVLAGIPKEIKDAEPDYWKQFAGVINKMVKPGYVTGKQEAEAEKSKIEDAGEKIGGARKDQWAGRGLTMDDLEGMTGAEIDRHVTKHNVWQKPDYVQAVADGVDPGAAAIIKRMYDGIAVKPTPDKYGRVDHAELRKRYIAALNAVREVAAEVKTVRDVRDLDDRVTAKLSREGVVDAWDAINSIKKAGSRVSPLYVSGRDIRAAERMVAEGFPQAEPWTRLFQVGEIFDKDNPFGVRRKNGGLISRHKTREEAEAAAKAAYDAMPDERKKGGEEPKRPHLDSVERSGPDYRKGKDVGSEDFIKDFGFRGVEFGNWVAGDERQKVVNLAYDALHDLARALNLPAKAMSLDGTLAVAFGARGKGGRAAAHYESDRTVINMTKLSGAGSLAHEWAHALDHYLGETHSQNPYKGSVQSLTGWRDTPTNPQTHYRFGKFETANKALPLKLRVAANRLMDTLFGVEEADHAAEDRIRKQIEAKKSGIKSWADQVNRIKERMKTGGSRQGLKQAEDQVEIWGRNLKALERQLEEGIVKKTVASNFVKEATKLSGTTGDYWRRPNELFARSFEAYVFDKIAAEGFASQYLVQGVEQDRYGAGFKGNPYPVGSEREAINAAYDRLFRALATTEGKHGQGTRIQGAEGEPEPVETVTKVVRPQAQPSPREEQKAVETAGLRAGGLGGVFQAHLEQGGDFPNILAARKMAKEAGFTDDAKEIEEWMEAAVVRTARGDIATSRTPQSAYKALVNLYGRQPKLGTRTSTSVRDQAYSTPVPLAYLASKLAGITENTSVFEPTAGNGALLIDANPQRTLANEMNDARAAQLRDQGFPTTIKDASEKGAFSKVPPRDVVVANPPFGPVKEGTETKVFDMSDIQPGYKTGQIDHVIALRAIGVMKDDGRAVLLLGGINKMAASEKARSDAYNAKDKREFYKVLYDNYGVTDHFTVAGELYERQGAGWPVDVVVIEGRKRSQRALPAVDVPRIYSSWDALGGVLDGLRPESASDARPAVGETGGAPETGAGLESGSERGVGRDGRDQSGVGQPGGVRAKRGAATAETGERGAGTGIQSGGRDQPARSGEQPVAERSSHGLSDDLDSILNDAVEAAYGEKPKAVQSDERGQPIIGTGTVLRTISGRETSPAPKIDGENNRKIINGVARMDAWLLDEARKEVARNDYQTTLLKGIDPKSMSQSDRDTVNSLLFGDPDGPRPSDVIRAETNKRPTPEVAKSAAKNAVEGADAAFDALHKLFGGNKASSGFTFDEETYAKAKPLFEQAAGKFRDAWGDIREFAKRMVAHMRDTLKWSRETMEQALPYLKRFMEEFRGEKVQEAKADQAAGETKAKRERAQSTAEETENQVTYTPQSKTPGLDTLVPVNMRRSISDSLADLESRVGPIDAFVGKELDYNSNELATFFSAEQVDAIGLAIDNLKRDKGFIIGDQTGIGKGRVNAAIIRWAYLHDRIPIFVTEKPGLYADMYRDMHDIGMDELFDNGPRILATNTGLKLPLNDAGTVAISNGDAKKHNAVLSRAADDFFKHHDMVFTNYSQMQTVNGEDTVRRQFLKNVVRRGVMIFDESHNAGGQSGGFKIKGASANRSQFARDLVNSAKGVFYSSATYAKRPDVMDLYSKTDMAMAVDDLDHLAEAIQRGGVPMQQVVATMLADAGQYIRRERSFKGINYNTPVIPVDRDLYDNVSRSLAAIQDLSASVSLAAERISAQLKAEAGAMSADNATGDAGASSTNFTAVMHNLINQMLLAMKVDPAAKRAIEAIERGEKPVLTVANTMESFLSDFADATGISPGEVISADFSDVLRKYLDRTRTIILKKAFAKKGETIRHYLTDDELGPSGVRAYNDALATINNMDLSSLPVSPIDHLKGELEKAGYRVGEITGRGLTVDYTGEQPVLRSRPGSETSTKGRNATRAAFNKRPKNGGLHAVIINQAGSTGISMHSSLTFDDQSKRRMFIVQPEGNIDTHMQLLGRVNRTGQVVLPEYDQLVADIPAEKRPAANLAKKMASLNANTTASRSSALTSKDVPDFLNEYGDQVAVSYLSDNLELNARLAFPVKVTDSGKMTVEDAMRKLTGRIPLLPLKEQEETYAALEGEYEALIQQLEAAGENALEAKTLDLKAKVLERSMVQDKRNNSGSPFAAPVTIEKVSIVRPGKPYKPEELVAKLMDRIGLPNSYSVPVDAMNEFASGYSRPAQAAAKIEREERASAVKDFNDYTRSILDDIGDAEKRAKKATELNAIKDRFETVHQLVPIGRRVTLKTVSGNLPGVVIDVERTGDAKNPLAMGSWKATFAIPDATKTMVLPFSRIVEDGKADPESVLDVEVVPTQNWIENPAQTLERFANKQTEAREERYIATGNLLAAYDWLDRRGAILNYTDNKGAIRQGILTSRDFKLDKHTIAKGKLLQDPREIRKWLDENTTMSIDGGDITVGRASQWSSDFTLSAKKAKKQGGRFYLDKDLTDITGDFYSRSGAMETTVGPDKIEKAIKRLQQLGAKFKVPAMAPKVEKVPDEPDTPDAAMARDALTAKAKAVIPTAQESITRIIRNLVGQSVDLEFHDGFIPINHSGGWGELSTNMARGLFYRQARLIKIALAGSPENILSSAFHEAYHAMEFLLQTPAERLLMERETPRLRKLVQRQMGYSDQEAAGLADSEVRAIAFENYATERATGKTRTGTSEHEHVGVRRWFAKAMDFVRQLGNMLRGLGFKTYKDIFNEGFEGSYRDRKPDGSGASEEPMAAMQRQRRQQSLDTIVDTRVAGKLNLTEARVQIQDKMIRVKKAEDSVGENRSSHSAYQAEGLYYGRTGERLERLDEDKVDPLVADIKARDLAVGDVNEYLYARHAQERNDRIGMMHEPGTQFNDAVFDHDVVGASGMSTNEANAILNRVATSGKLADYQAVEKRIRDIIDSTRQTLLNSGLISQETYDDWGRQYQNYVPLRGFAEANGDETVDSGGMGGGMQTRGKEAKQAFGRSSEADGPLKYIIHQAMSAIIRAEKNRVGNTMLRFVQDNPDPERWIVNKPTFRHVVDKTTGLIRTVPDNFAEYNDPRVFITKIGGKPYAIHFEGPDGANIARAMNNMGTAQLHAVVRTIGAVTRFLGRINTSWNPEFFASNFARDLGEAFVNMQEADQKEFVKAFRKHLIGSMMGSMQALAGKNAGGKYVQAFHEFDKAGGRTRFFGLESPEDIDANVDRKMRRLEGGALNTIKDDAEKLGHGVEIFNSAFENGTRLATYMAARDVGKSQADAATMAQNITVNFTRKGELGSAISSAYMFANASIQGSARLVKALQYKRVRRAVYMLTAAAAASAIYNLLVGGDDETGKPYYERVQPYIRDKNWIIMWPKGFGRDGDYAKIPGAYGYNMFKVLGDRAAAVMLGKEKVTAAIGAFLGSVADAFDPLGGDENWVAKFSPTIVRPAVHLYTNKSWTGKPMYPDHDYDKGLPDSSKSFSTNSDFAKAVTSKLNTATGGDAYQPGAIDLHPATVDEYLSTLTGGLGRFAKGTASMIFNGVTEGEWDASKTPIVRRFFGRVNSPEGDRAAYYEARQSANEIKERISRAKSDLKRGVNVDESQKFLEKHEGDASEIEIFKSADKQMKQLRQQEVRLNNDRSITDADRKAQVKEIRDQMRSVQNEARKQVRELKMGQRGNEQQGQPTNQR